MNPTTRVVFCLAALAILGAMPASAAPKQGFAVSYGSAHHNTEGEWQDGTEFNWSAKGTTLMLDYQIPTGNFTSINLGYMGTVGNMTGEVAGAPVEGTAGYGGFFVQGRLWLGGLFLGVHVISAVEVVEFKEGKDDYVGDGTGYGYALGLEGDNWFLAGMVDILDLSYASTDDIPQPADGSVTGTRVVVGYRWGSGGGGGSSGAGVGAAF